MDVRRTYGIVGALRASRRPPRPRISGGETEYLIQDPHHEYAARLIGQLHAAFGYRAVCFYTDRRERLFHQRRFPILQSERVAASYDVGIRDLSRFAAHVAEKHRVAAILPFNEPTVAPAVELARLLQLDWAQPEVLRRFHDKFALKEHIRAHHPKVRLNASRRIETLEDVLQTRLEPAYREFILKPNNGFGNRGIGRFDADTDPAVLESFLGGHSGTPLLMEEYIDGTEYFINGQVGRDRISVAAIFEYVRLPANGRHNIDTQTLLVPHRDPRFAPLAAYAEEVVRATGLQRSPFHLELKASSAGPCLIEIGARLAGHGNAFLCEELHGSKLDLFGLAAHYYFKADDYGPIPLDWDAYDSRAVRYVHGVASARDRIFRLDGVEEVEALPEFHRWVAKPRIGARLEPSRDVLSMPVSLILKGTSQEQLAEAARKVGGILQINRSVSPVRRAALSAGFQVPRIARAARMRLQSFAEVPEGTLEPIEHHVSVRGLWRGAEAAFVRTLRRIRRKAQLLEIGTHASEPPQPPSADASEQAEKVLQWAGQYLGRPHPRLGRPGAICPFVRPSIDAKCFHVKCYDDAGGDIGSLRELVLWEARSFRRTVARTHPDGPLSSVVLAFPRMTDETSGVLDLLHDDLKTHLVARYELMSSPFHPRSVKPSVSNPEFAVFRAPLPMFVLRHLGVRDISFIGTNEAAFRRYHALFSKLFERGEVSDEFGHVSGFIQACRRFKFKVPDGLCAAPVSAGALEEHT